MSVQRVCPVKIAVHPLVVAAALGLLSPVALAEEAPEQDGHRIEADNDHAHAFSMIPSADELDRAEAEWLEVRDLY